MSLWNWLSCKLWLRRKRTPLYIQMESAECGAACLKIIMAYYGKYLPIDELRLACGVSRDGCTAEGILQACEAYDLECDGYSFTLEELKGQSFPCIVYWGFNHFIVLEDIRGKKYYINDPAIGRIAIHEDNFRRSYTGVILQIRPKSTFRKDGKRPGFIPSFLRRIRPVASAMPALLLMQFGTVFLSLVLALLAKVFVDHIIQGQFPIWRWWFLGIASFSALLMVVLTYFSNILLVKAQIKLDTLFSTTFFTRLFKLPIAFFEQRYASEIAYRSTLNQQAAGFITGHLFEAVIQVITIFVYGIAIYLLSKPVAIAVILCGCMNLFVVSIIHNRRLSIFSRYRQEVGKAASFSMSALEGFETWKCLGIESSLFSRMASLYTRSINVLHELQNTDQVLANFSYISRIAGTGILFVLGGSALLDGGMTQGQFAALFLLIGFFMKPTERLIEINRNFELFQVDIARLDDVVDHPADPKFLSKPHFQEVQPFLGGIEFKDVTYRYNVNHPPVLKGISFSIPPGKKVALIGATGSGKTTVAKLLSGFISQESGAVKIDGTDLKDFPSDYLSRRMAFVFDTPFIYEGTVRSNITLYDSAYTDDDILKALEEVQLSDRFKEWLLGEELEEEGKNISGGEKQRLELARALVRNPSFLVLDEATSSLDSATERAIFERIQKRNCGMLILTHRLSTIGLCDEVNVLQDGRIIQRGTPEELAKTEGPFKTMLSIE